jgi:hypothetical protein
MLRQNWRVIAAVALGLLLAVSGLVGVLAQRGTRIAGTNSLVEVSGAAVPVPPGERRCTDEHLPPGATAVRVYAGTFARRGETFAIDVLAGGRRVTGGRVGGGYGDDAMVRVPLRPVTRERERARVCVRNLGRHPLRFAGNRTPVAGARPDGDEAIRMDWLLPGRPSWAEVAPKAARRFAAAKPSFVGPWTLWVVAGAVLALWAAAIALVIREARS